MPLEFSDRHQLILELAYYPPYHRKYNPMERCLQRSATLSKWKLIIDPQAE